jgi:hypothetical protein
MFSLFTLPLDAVRVSLETQQRLMALFLRFAFSQQRSEAVVSDRAEASATTPPISATANALGFAIAKPSQSTSGRKLSDSIMVKRKPGRHRP